MKEIPLTKGKVAIVDDDDYDVISKYNWYFHKNGYALRNRIKEDGTGGKVIRMHRVISGAEEGSDVDHINGDKLDNRKVNLRVVSRSQNNYNRRIQSNNTSGYKGVSWSKQKGKWHARIFLNNRKLKHLGFFDDVVDAAKAYNIGALMYHREHAKLNEIKGGLDVNIKRFNKNAVVPFYAKDEDSGFDLVAVEDVLIGPGETAKIPIGWGFDILPGHELQIRPRSGITSNTKLRVQFGTIDRGFVGEVSVTVDNIAAPVILGFNYNGLHLDHTLYPRGLDDKFIEEEALLGSYVDRTYLIRKGDRIAQGVVAPVKRVNGFNEVDELRETERGANGFGHSGVTAE